MYFTPCEDQLDFHEKDIKIVRGYRPDKYADRIQAVEISQCEMYLQQLPNNRKNKLV